MFHSASNGDLQSSVQVTVTTHINMWNTKYDWAQGHQVGSDFILLVLPTTLLLHQNKKTCAINAIMKTCRHLERAIELLQPKLQFGTYKESPYDIKLVNNPASIVGALDYGVIIGYQVTLQPIKVGKFPTPPPPQASIEDRARHDEWEKDGHDGKRQQRQVKYHQDRDRVDAGKFDEVLDDISRNNDIFTVEQPILDYDVLH